MVAELLTNIAAQGLTVGVNRIQACISRFFAIAVNQGLRDDNPAARLIKRFKETPRTRVLTETEIRTLYAELEARPSEAADVFWLRLLLGQRAEETGGMRWSELDLEARTWFLDGVRTKNGLEHLLWLPDLALAVITRRRAALPDDAKYVFPALAGERQPKIQRDISTAIAALLPNFTWKDLRRTMSTTLGDLGIDEGVIDRLLNHKAATIGRRHYNHAKYLPEKQVALAAWDREITRIIENKPKTARVIPMPSR
jgi:integrase